VLIDTCVTSEPIVEDDGDSLDAQDVSDAGKVSAPLGYQGSDVVRDTCPPVCTYLELVVMMRGGVRRGSDRDVVRHLRCFLLAVRAKLLWILRRHFGCYSATSHAAASAVAYREVVLGNRVVFQSG